MRKNNIINSENKDQFIVIALIIGIGIVILITVFSLISIWIPKKTIKDPVIKETIGQIEIKKFTEEEIVLNYYAQIYGYLISNNNEMLYAVLDKEYIKHEKLTEKKFNTLIENKKIAGKKLEVEKYKKIELEGYNNVYIVYFHTADRLINERVTIKEISPNNYTVVFDNFISYKEPNKVIEQEGLKMTVNNILINQANVGINLTLENIGTKKVIINKEKTFQAIKGICNSSIIKPMSSNIVNKEYELMPGGTIKINVFYIIDQDNNKINGIYIDNIFYPGDNRYENLKFNF